jgi:hypothetical protein
VEARVKPKARASNQNEIIASWRPWFVPLMLGGFSTLNLVSPWGLISLLLIIYMPSFIIVLCSRKGLSKIREEIVASDVVSKSHSH